MPVRWITRSAIAAAWTLLLAGCPPQLDEFAVVDGPVAGDGGGVRMPAEPDFGTPCTVPWLAVTVESLSSSAGSGQVRRYQLPSLEPCRESTLGVTHPSLGGQVYAVTGLPDGTEAIGVAGAVLKLDGEGFPVWRQQVERTAGFRPLELFVTSLGGAPRLAAAYWDDRGSSMAGVLLMDTSGAIVHEWTEGLFGANTLAPDPSTPGNVLIARYSDVHTAPLDTASDRIEDGTELLPRMDGAGSLITIDTDPSTGRVVLAYAGGILTWAPPTSPAHGLVTCGAPCGDFHAATWDPTDADAVLALCDDADDGRVRHLMRVHVDGTCELAADGTFLDDRRMTELCVIGTRSE